VTALKENMSPVRTVKVAPMLVERKINDIGWRRVSLDSREIVKNREFKKAIAEFRSSDYNQITLHKTLRLRRSSAEITADLYTPISYDEFVRKIEKSGFRLPTEDEWEYLCGGGLRTLFRWGDSFDYDIHLYHFEKVTPEKTEYDLQQPNQFGIFIAYDPFTEE
jgi:hypothetical protein